MIKIKPSMWLAYGHAKAAVDTRESLEWMDVVALVELLERVMLISEQRRALISELSEVIERCLTDDADLDAVQGMLAGLILSASELSVPEEPGV